MATTYRYADVCVTEGHNYQKNCFTYAIPEEMRPQITPGMMAQVPFGKKELTGFVMDFSNNSEYKTKHIQAITRDYPVLTVNQMKLADWMHKYFYTPTPLCLIHFLLPTFPKKIDTSIAQEPQKLILIPTPNYEFETSPPHSELPIFHHKLGSKDKQKIWLHIYEGKGGTIIGTRSALFLPYRNLTEIQILSAESDYYRERRAPLYNAVQIASRLAKMHRAQLGIAYSEEFKAELAERKELGLPPYQDLLCLTPLKSGPKSLIESQKILLELKEKVEKQHLPIHLYRSHKDAKTPEIFIQGTHLHDFLPEPPKGWRVQVVFTNLT